MKLFDFPRPPKDNGIGIHLGLDLTKKNAQADLEHCLDMNIKWVTIWHHDRDILIRTAKLFWDNEIMPVLRPHRLINRTTNWGGFTKAATDALGFSPYIQVYNEPSDNREWIGGKPRTWLEDFTQQWHRAANDVAMAGGLPGLQVLSTRELRAVIQFGFHEKGWFCPHNYGCKLPPEYYVKGEGRSIGVLSFLDFAEVFNEKLGYVPPFICGEGGWFFGGIPDSQHADWTTEMYGWFRYGRIWLNETGLMMPTPNYLFAINPWILSGGGTCPWYGWDTATGTIEAVKAMSGFVRGRPEPEPENWRVTSPYMTEDEAWNELADLEKAGFHTYALEERDHQ